MDDDAALLGVDLPELEAEDPDFWVDAENWDAVETFIRCGTQWRSGPMGGVFGLDYPGVKTVLDITQSPTRHHEIFTALQIMEQAAMAIINQAK